MLIAEGDFGRLSTTFANYGKSTTRFAISFLSKGLIDCRNCALPLLNVQRCFYFDCMLYFANFPCCCFKRNCARISCCTKAVHACCLFISCFQISTGCSVLTIYMHQSSLSGLANKNTTVLLENCSDVVETVTSETETETWLKFRDETETLT